MGCIQGKLLGWRTLLTVAGVGGRVVSQGLFLGPILVNILINGWHKNEKC